MSQQHLHIEVWDKAAWSLNTFVGYESVPLIEIASGPIKQNLKIFDKTEKHGISTQQVCELTFQLNFEEIWDFRLSFHDFKATDLTYRGTQKWNKKLNPKLRIRLESDSILSRSNEVESKAVASAMPNWIRVGEKGIKFRGTNMQL